MDDVCLSTLEQSSSRRMNIFNKQFLYFHLILPFPRLSISYPIAAIVMIHPLHCLLQILNIHYSSILNPDFRIYCIINYVQ
jgi:hypothetical protein